MNATRYLLAFALLLAVVSADSKFPIVDYSSSPWVVTLTDTYYDQAAMTTLFEYTITPRTGVPAADLSHWTINPFCPQAELVNKDEWSYGLDTHTDMTGYRSQFGHESTASATVFVLEFEGMVPITDGIVFAVKGNGEYAKSTIRGPNCAVSSVVYPQVPAPDDTSDIYCTDSRVSGPALPPDTTEPPRTYTFVGDETTSERCQHYKNVDRTIQVTDGELVTRYTYQANLRDEIGPDFVSVAGDSPNECAGDRAFILANLPDNHTTTANDQCSGDVDDEHMELCEEIRFDDECPVKILITRTWTAQDDCGNSKCHTQTISYDDTKAPILSNKPGDVEVECPTNWTNAAQVAQYQAAIQQPVITASDDCMTTKPKVNLTKKRIDGECKNTWTLQRTWTVEDECGNSDDHTQYLTVFDETPPVWETNGLPTTVNKQCDEDLSPVWDVTAVDGCSGQTYDTPYTESESGSNPEKCPQDRTIKFTYTTCDDCGNTADDLIRFIKVGDDSPPTWNEDVPAIFGSNLNSDPSLEVYQLDDVSCDDIPTRPQFTANDTCDTATVTSPFDTDDAGPRCTNDRVIIWHYKACDSCDNCIERYIHVNVVDNIDPVIDMTTVPDDDFNVECKTLTPLENINVQTLDDGTSCIEKDDATVTPSQSPRFDEMCLYNYTVTRTWTAQDNCGNTDPVTRTFVVRDNNPPDIIGVPPHTSAYCNAPPASTDVYATDGCSDSTYLDSQLVMTPTGTRPTSGCINYTQTYTWDVQDHCEHKDSDHQDIEVYDNVDPYFIEELFPKDVSVRCDKFADVSTAKPPAGDGCAGVLSVSDHTDTVVAGPAATCKYNRTIERSWTVTDECLNTFTREQTITVFDNKKPDLIGVPENDRVPCHAVPCPPAVTAEDNCNDVKISFKEERVDNVDPDCVDTYTLLRTWTATDACGLEFSKTQVLEVFDEEDPWFFTEPENITELCTGTPPLPDIMTDQGRDLCDKNVEVTGPAVDPSETCHGNKTILYTWTAHDNCGGTKDYVQRITIYDNVGPYWRPAELDDETAECGVDIVPEWPNVGDECTNQDIDYVKDDPDHLDITEVPGSRTCVGNYSLDYTWTATDHCGNPSSITQRFNVYDTKKPIFTNCPGDVIVDCSEIPDVPPVNATDPHSCDNDVDVTYLGETPSTPDSECAHSYTLTREWLAEDDCGHTEMCTQVITVEDQHDPEILGVPETDDNVKCDDVPPPPPVCVHDNCNGVDMWFAESKDTECTGTYNLTRTWTAEDTCGRPAEVKSYVVHVVDDIDPEWNDDLEPPASREYECGDYTEPPKPEGTDTCGGASSVETGRTGENDVLDPNNFPNCNERDITLTWTLTDDCSNSVPRSHVLNVRDNRQPSINFIPALQAEVTDTCTVPTPPTPSSATDDCGISNTPQRTHSDDTTSCPYIFNRTYSWNVNDDCGLAAPTKTQKLIMEDPGLPSWDNEADNNEEDWYVCDTIVPDDTPTATDACGANITPINGPNTLGGFDANASGCRQNFTETRRWTATDVCANDLTWNQILHFYDVVAPTFDARDEPLQPLHNQCSQQNVPDLNSTDNCQTARTTVVALSHEQTNILCPYRYTVEHKYEAEDECSNTRQTTEPQVYTWDAEPSITVGGVSIDQLPAFQSKTVQCDSIPDLPDTVGQDACGVTLTVTDTDYVPVNADECNYELKRTWSVEDACGVPWSHTQTLTVVDSIAPALHGVPLSTTAECGFVPPAANVTATDSCPGVKLVMTEHRVGWTPENCCDYTLVRTWTATDKCSGLETVESQDIIVSDTNPPEIHNVPEDVTLECLDDGVPGWPTDPEVTAEEAPLGRGHCIDEDIASSSCTPAGTSPPNTATIDGAAFYFTNDAHVITWINGVAFIAGDLTDGTTTYSVNFQLSGKVLANSTSVTDAANLGLNDDCYVANNGDAPVNPNDWKAYTILQGNLTDSSETVHDATMTSEVALIGTGANNYNDGPGARIEFTFDGKAGAFVLQLSDDCDGAWRLYPTLACGPEVTLETDEEIIAYHGCDGRYDILRTWTATDRSDEVTTLTQLIRMRDRVGPKWVQATVPPLNSPATQAEYGCEYPQPGDPQLYDECSNSTEMRTGPTQSPVGETCAHRGSRTYTWGGKDDCNNTAEPVSQTLHRWDGLAPTPTVVPPFVEGSTVERQCTLPPLPSVSWQDNCASPLAVETHNDGDLNPTNTNSCPYHFDVTRSWTAEDVCGNDRTIEYDIEVRDTNPPIKPANPPTSYKVECTSHGFYPADDNDMVFTDECSGVLAPVSHSDTDNRGDPGTCEGGYEVTRTWTATDECNLSTPHTITVTVEDLAKPWINVDHLTAPCDDIPTPEETRVNVTFGDSCDPNPTLVWVEDEDSREPDSCAYDYKILRTWKVTDDCGKENTAVQEITIYDDEAPVLSPRPQNTRMPCDDVQCPELVKANDNCKGVYIAFKEERDDSFGCANEYLLTRTWTATDLCSGKKDEVVQTIEVYDEENPRFTTDPLPQSQIGYECRDVNIDIMPNVEGEDDCGFDQVYTADPHTPPACENFTFIRTWNATDLCGLHVVHTQEVTVKDTGKPYFLDEPAAWYDQLYECAPEATNDPNANDACGSASVTGPTDSPKDNEFCKYNYTFVRTWTATDNCLHTETETQNVRVHDPTAPYEVNPLPVHTVKCDELVAPTVPTYGVHFDDNCSKDAGEFTVTPQFTHNGDVGDGNRENSDPDCPHDYVLRRPWVITDACGHELHIEEVMSVYDAYDPVLDFKPTEDFAQCHQLWDQQTIGATDTCTESLTVVPDAVNVTNSPAGVPECPGNYDLLRSWYVEDCSGRSDSHNQPIAVRDTLAPEWDANSLPQSYDSTECVYPAYVEPTAWDHCGFDRVDLRVNNTSPSCPGSYVVTRTWVAVDLCGLESAPHTQTITVTDEDGPDFPSPPPPTASYECHEYEDYPIPDAVDTCSGLKGDVTLTDPFDKHGCFGNRTVYRTWTATDNCDNPSTTDQDASVTDTQKPFFENTPPDYEEFSCDAIPDAWTPEASDLCSPNNVSISGVSEDTNPKPRVCTHNYTLERTWTATDECGHTQDHTHYLLIRDYDAPFLSIPADDTVECDDIPCPGEVIASDNCGDVTVEFDERLESFDCTLEHKIRFKLHRTWTVTDECGHTTSKTQVITVTDKGGMSWFTDPLPDAEVSVKCQDYPDTPDILYAVDTCGSSGQILATSEDSDPYDYEDDDCLYDYYVKRTWTATDECNNPLEYVQTIHVYDDEDPTTFAISDTCLTPTLFDTHFEFEDATEQFSFQDQCENNMIITIISCTSDQDGPDMLNVTNVGGFTDDCQWDSVNDRLSVRVRTDLGQPNGRTFTVTAKADDRCGNTETQDWHIWLPLDDQSTTTLPNVENCVPAVPVEFCDGHCPCRYNVELCKQLDNENTIALTLNPDTDAGTTDFEYEVTINQGTFSDVTIGINLANVEIVDLHDGQIGTTSFSDIQGVTWEIQDVFATIVDVKITVRGVYTTNDLENASYMLLGVDSQTSDAACVAGTTQVPGVLSTGGNQITGTVGLQGTLFGHEFASIIVPLPNVVVQLRDRDDFSIVARATTDANGQYTVTEPSTDCCTINLESSGFLELDFSEGDLDRSAEYIRINTFQLVSGFEYGLPVNASAGTPHNVGLFFNSMSMTQASPSFYERTSTNIPGFQGNARSPAFWAHQIRQQALGTYYSPAEMADLIDIATDLIPACTIGSDFMDVTGQSASVDVLAALTKLRAVALNHAAGRGPFDPYRGLQELVIKYAQHDLCASSQDDLEHVDDMLTILLDC